MRRAGRWLALMVVAWRSAAAAEPAPQPHLVMLIAEDEYRTRETLPAFATQELTPAFRVTTITSGTTVEDGIPGLESVPRADVLLVSVRRRPLPGRQLAWIRRHVADGRPVVGIRTASHAFHLRQGQPPAGLEQWPTFDAEVFGGTYSGHLPPDQQATAQRLPDVEHPILAGLPAEAFATGGSLYLVAPLAKSATELVRGRVDATTHQPVAWINRRADGGWSFYTSLGHPEDFASAPFRRLLANGVRWAARPR